MCVCVSVCVMGVCKCVSHMRGNEIFIIGRLSSHGADWVQITRSGDKKKQNTKWSGCQRNRLYSAAFQSSSALKVHYVLYFQFLTKTNRALYRQSNRQLPIILAAASLLARLAIHLTAHTGSLSQSTKCFRTFTAKTRLKTFSETTEANGV